MTRAAVARLPASVATSPRASAAVGYLQRSETPLTMLAFLLPLVVAYEVGIRRFVMDPIVAFTLLRQFFGLFGASGQLLPAAAIVVILLISHIVRRDPWKIVWSDVLKMAGESILLALPLIVLWYAAGPYLLRLPLFASAERATGMTVPCIGAGIYEELIFRLIAFNLMSFVLVDLMRTRTGWAYTIMVVLSAVSFSAYHYLGYEHFTAVSFIFRAIAGLYFAAIFLCRGFGVTCGCHASYDIIVVCLQLLH